MRQARYWICTIPRDDWVPCLVEGTSWIYGQPELGESGYRHWQFIAAFAAKKTIRQVKALFPSSAHVESTRSSAAETYCRKEDTRDGEQFEFGRKPFQRNSATDWESVRNSVKSGDIDAVPPDIFIRYYRSLRAISADYAVPRFIEREIRVFHGPTGTGKSRRAWEEAGATAYCKDPRSKFWCGYNNQKEVIIDEFRGGIDIAHLLRWFDRYPVNVELKGASIPLSAERIWVTSNLHPDQWYPELDSATLDALKRRMNIELIE